MMGVRETAENSLDIDSTAPPFRVPKTAELVAQELRNRIPGVSIATDIIVGFPGETEAAFQNTYDLLADLRLDVAHLARYSPRPGTYSARELADSVPAE